MHIYKNIYIQIQQYILEKRRTLESTICYNMFQLGISVLLIVALAAEAVVHPLVKENFTTFLEQNPVAVVEFYAPWYLYPTILATCIIIIFRCGYCKKFGPIYDEASEILAVDGVRLGKVDCVEETTLYWENDIKGYPTIKVYLFGEHILYEGARELNAIVNFVKEMVEPGTIDIDSSSGGVSTFIDSRITQTVPVVVAFLDANEASGKVAKNALDLACKRVGRISCGVTADLSGIAQFSDSTPGPMPVFTIIKPFTGPFEDSSLIASFGGADVTSESVSSLAVKIAGWMRRNSFPVVTEFTTKNQELLFSQDRPGYNIHIILLENGRGKSLDAFGFVASQHLGECVFIHLDTSNPEGDELIPNLINDLNVDVDSLPQIKIIKSAKTQLEFYDYQSTGGEFFSVKALNEIVDDFFSSRVSPTKIINAASSN